jgi:heterodisulfide reductase subunit B
MKYSYFPGCSLKGTGRAYEESLLQVLKILGIELVELDDWNCCGATAYMAVDEVKACVMASRNLAIAEKTGCKELLAPCSACYLVLNKTKHYLHESPAVEKVIQTALQQASLSYSGNTPVRHPLDVLVNDVGIAEIKKHVKQPLKGLRVAAYYGCQIVRPYASFDDQYNPTTMDRLLGYAARAGPALLLHPAQGGDQARRRGRLDRVSSLPVQPRLLPRQDDRPLGRRNDPGSQEQGHQHPGRPPA